MERNRRDAVRKAREEAEKRGSGRRMGMGRGRRENKTEDKKTKKIIIESLFIDPVAVCMYDYTSSGPGQLSFKRGDRILILAKDPAGWWTGELNGVLGISLSPLLRSSPLFFLFLYVHLFLLLIPPLFLSPAFHRHFWCRSTGAHLIRVLRASSLSLFFLSSLFLASLYLCVFPSILFAPSFKRGLDKKTN